jgi:hypothetical protein
MMGQMTSARLQADSAVADMALLYRDDPLLRPFPVSRLVMDEATITLKVLCAAGVCTFPGATAATAAAVLGLLFF